jgi:hypothetical protein
MPNFAEAYPPGKVVTVAYVMQPHVYFERMHMNEQGMIRNNIV